MELSRLRWSRERLRLPTGMPARVPRLIEPGDNESDVQTSLVNCIAHVAGPSDACDTVQLYFTSTSDAQVFVSVPHSHLLQTVDGLTSLLSWPSTASALRVSVRADSTTPAPPLVLSNGTAAVVFTSASAGEEVKFFGHVLGMA